MAHVSQRSSPTKTITVTVYVLDQSRADGTLRVVVIRHDHDGYGSHEKRKLGSGARRELTIVVLHIY
jgi:hypothetical protein